MVCCCWLMCLSCWVGRYDVCLCCNGCVWWVVGVCCSLWKSVV